MGEKIQIVNRHHLRRGARRHQQRMHRVRDVPIAARKHLRRRPLETMPCEVQKTDRHSPIDDGGRCEIRRRS